MWYAQEGDLSNQLFLGFIYVLYEFMEITSTKDSFPPQASSLLRTGHGSKWQAKVTKGAKMVRERAMATDGLPITALLS